ncbi:retrovirus-related pol polyprotein from transposon TNT 1-94 [Tanacetum coccineum]
MKIRVSLEQILKLMQSCKECVGSGLQEKTLQIRWDMEAVSAKDLSFEESDEAQDDDVYQEEWKEEEKMSNIPVIPYGMNGLEDELEKVLWEYLKNMFEAPLSTDPIWSSLGQQRIISWRYYTTCRVHCLNLESSDIYMLTERKYPLTAKSTMSNRHKDWLVQEQTALGKDFSNPLMADNLPKIVWLSTHHICRPWTCTFLVAKGLATPELMANCRFSWVFFLATKDETSGILKSFITGVENLIDQRVKREFSVARTPQQNGVAKRKNRTLIEAARIMLADSKLPTTFWAKAVNTTCYVKNRVLVTKPLNKTPYELFLGRKPALDFMRLFGYLVTILNTIDHLVKFDGKADEGFFLGYSINIIAGNQSNSNAGTKACDDAGKEGGDSSKEDESDDQEKDDNVNSTNTVNTASDGYITNNVNVVSSTVNAAGIEVNVVGAKTSIELPDDPNMPELEDIVYSDDDEDVGAEADMNNLDAFMPVSPILTTRIHKDHPVEQIIRDLNSAPQTRRMTKNLEEHDLPNGKRAIRTKWVYRNKKDERGIVIKNKARLVTQGYTPEEGIDYDEVFATIARIEAIRLFLSYASFKDFVVYQMDVKSAFLYGKIEEEVYVYQPPGFEDPDFPNRVYKVEKALYGLRQAPRAWDKGDILLVQVYVDDIIFGSIKKSLCTEFEKIMHKKFQMSSMGELTFFLGLQLNDVKTANIPMETHKPLLKDADGEDIDEHLYRSMIGSLMYLTSSRPDIMFTVCQPKLGLWYPKDSPFDLVAFTDSDFAIASLDRKSTTRGCQFLGCRLISWQCKKQIVVANSITEAEYIATSN